VFRIVSFFLHKYPEYMLLIM